MLAFDIETSGVDRLNDLITVIALYDPENNIERVLRFVEKGAGGDGALQYRDSETMKRLTDELVQLMDAANTLCCFNGLSFDIPFIQQQLKIPCETVQLWVLKTFDVLEICRRGFSRTFKLDMALQLNNVGSGKTGSGLEAVKQANEGRWDELEKYCLDDAKLTHSLSTLPSGIRCPENYKWRKQHNDTKTHDPDRVFHIHLHQRGCDATDNAARAAVADPFSANAVPWMYFKTCAI